jgi:hypothetical protein
MTQVYPGDLVRVAANGRFYYAITLDKIRLFGGQLCFVFHRTSEQPLESAEVLRGPLEGFYEIVDFIWAKREGRLVRIGKKLDTSALNRGVSFFKTTFTTRGKAKEWHIVDRDGEEQRRVQKLSVEEARYPLFHRIDDVLMVGLVDQRWSPEKDDRI